MSGFTNGIRAALRATFGRETLPPPPPAQARLEDRPGALWILLGPDPFPPDLPPATSPRAAPPRGSPGAIPGPDAFPSDLPPLPRRGGRWLAWLFAAEPLDP
jgi:hypothetical protein